MLNTLIFDDSIVVFWDRIDFKKNEYYQLALNGECVGNISKTHYTFSALIPQTEYCITLSIVQESGVKELETICVKTQAQKRRMDITKPPYNAVGGGEVMNTAAIQKAIDDCGAGDCVYIPQGTFLCGALRLHSDMELYLEEGAILLGSTQVADYMPKINSRFEGLEMQCLSSMLNIGELDKDAGYTTKNVVIRGAGRIVGGGIELCQNVIDSETLLLQEYLA